MKKSVFTSKESSAFRLLLEKHLILIAGSGDLTDNKIQPYGAVDWESLTHDAATMPDLTCIKSAYNIWLSMHKADRYAVLNKVKALFNKLQGATTGNHHTIAFCWIFIHQFAQVLTNAAIFPD